MAPNSPLRLLAAVAVLALVAIGSWLGARASAEPAVQTIPLEPAQIAVPVERRILEAVVIDRGTVDYQSRQTVQLPELGGGSIVTWLPSVETEIQHGDLLAEVNGRPIFALAGSSPSYRLLKLGTAGRDVVQFQQAMFNLGLRTEPPTGIFDQLDESAVATLYIRSGYEPATRKTVSGVKGFMADWRALTGGTLQCDNSCSAEVLELHDVLIERYRAAGPVLPLNEALFLDDLPYHVRSRSSRSIGESALDISGSSMEATVVVGRSQASQLTEGMKAIIDLDAGGLETLGVVTAVTPGVAEETGLWVISVALEQSEQALLGQVARVRFLLSSSEVPVLAVPIAALFTGGDGLTSVMVEKADGSTKRVIVEVGIVAQGFAEVEASEGSLNVSDYVVVATQGG